MPSKKKGLGNALRLKDEIKHIEKRVKHELKKPEVNGQGFNGEIKHLEKKIKHELKSEVKPKSMPPKPKKLAKKEMSQKNKNKKSSLIKKLFSRKNLVLSKLFKKKVSNKPLIKKKVMKKEVKIPVSVKEKHVKEQRKNVKKVLERAKIKEKTKQKEEYLITGIKGLDDMLVKGVPKDDTVLIAGGTGTGKTILCLNIVNNLALQGKKCLYMSLEESENKLKQHMQSFGWAPSLLEKKGLLMIKRINPFEISRSVEALLSKAKGELLIDVEPVVIPENFKPDVIVVDSLSAIASAFTGREDSYRIYIEQLFRLFEKMDVTAFLITETQQVPAVYSQSGVEEFLADGVIVLYSIKHGSLREHAIEVLKMRGVMHSRKVVAMNITSHGIEVYTNQEIYTPQ